MCISGLQPKELTQLYVANGLLFTSIRLMMSAAISGVPCILEHPVEPSDCTRPSIWQLPWLRMMTESGYLTKHVIQQARFGATAVKPTTLAVGNIPYFKVHMAKFTVPVVWSELEVLAGRRENGSWRTAVAKEYPSPLNRALAFCLARAHTTRAAKCTEFKADASFLEHVQALYAGDVDLHCQVMHPDFGGRTERDQLD